jgi:hypothetical protein
MRKRCFVRELCTLPASISSAPSIFTGSLVSSSNVSCLLIDFKLSSLSQTSPKSSPFATRFIRSPIFPNFSKRICISRFARCFQVYERFKFFFQNNRTIKCTSLIDFTVPVLILKSSHIILNLYTDLRIIWKYWSNYKK